MPLEYFEDLSVQGHNQGLSEEAKESLKTPSVTTVWLYLSSLIEILP